MVQEIRGKAAYPMPAMSLEDKLDEALKETFPASDAFALSPETLKVPPATNEPADGQPQAQDRAARGHE